VIAAAAPRRAAGLTVGILLTAIIRSVLLPLGELPAAVGFVIALAGLLVVERWVTPSLSGYPLPARGRETPFFLAAAAGVVTGLVLMLPVMGAGASGRALSGFWGWGAAILVIATLEEVVIRGRLQPAWTAEAGPIAGLLVSAVVFALIHLPRYGLGAMPLDFAVGLALGGLRAVTGRVAPCAIAHVIADWGAWFWL
jgi:membrane protease YdiL (CAAX protease family)